MSNVASARISHLRPNPIDFQHDDNALALRARGCALSCARVFTMLMCSHALMLAARHSPQVLTGILVTHACCSRVSAAEARKAAEKAAEAAALEATARTSPVASGASRRTSGTRSRAVASSLDEHPSSPMPVSHLVGPPLSTASMERLINIDRYTLWKGRIV